MLSVTQSTLPSDKVDIARDLALALRNAHTIDERRAAMRAARERTGDDAMFELVKGRALAGMR